MHLGGMLWIFADTRVTNYLSPTFNSLTLLKVLVVIAGAKWALVNHTEGQLVLSQPP